MANLQSLQKLAPASLKVYPLEVCFNDGNQRDLHSVAHVEEYGLASNAAKDSRVSGTLFMVASGPHPVWKLTQAYRSGDWTDEEREKHEKGLAEWHSFTVLYKDRKIYIYDPCYLPPATPSASLRRLVTFPNLQMARNLINQMVVNQRRRVDEIWVGGGGNTTQDCRGMTARWMEDLVLRLARGEDIDLIGWEHIRK
ncbi:MAG: hypothetical protein M1816_007532 [Peltula sp. TS41687]|nr:MAG: hypothetical protein M1816_007532 [Peltula sp. TS41687]